jgi:hypothetical protein
VTTTAETLAAIAERLPNGFHDAELRSLAVDWTSLVATIVGEAWAATDGPSEVYRPFRLVMSGLHNLALPDRQELRVSGSKWQRIFPDAPPMDGLAGWPADRPAPDSAPPTVPAYSFFVFSWNDFITVQAERAELTWLGPAYERGRG